jgi:pectin methylesterase-like acyl-CoA thioesterase
MTPVKYLLKIILGSGILLVCLNSLAGPDDSLYMSLDDSIDLVVATDSSGDYLTVQEAVDAVPDGNTENMIIYIRN